MMTAGQVYAQAALLAGELEPRQQTLLRALCGAAVTGLTARLREDVSGEDCRETLILAASLYALAALGSAEEDGMTEFKAGDLTVKRGTASGDAASRCLEKQAERLVRPYVKDSFSFRGV